MKNYCLFFIVAMIFMGNVGLCDTIRPTAALERRGVGARLQEILSILPSAKPIDWIQEEKKLLSSFPAEGDITPSRLDGRMLQCPIMPINRFVRELSQEGRYPTFEAFLLEWNVFKEHPFFAFSNPEVRQFADTLVSRTADRLAFALQIREPSSPAKPFSAEMSLLLTSLEQETAILWGRQRFTRLETTWLMVRVFARVNQMLPYRLSGDNLVPLFRSLEPGFVNRYQELLSTSDYAMPGDRSDDIYKARHFLAQRSAEMIESAV